MTSRFETRETVEKIKVAVDRREFVGTALWTAELDHAKDPLALQHEVGKSHEETVGRAG